jgi:hypothetical protein
MTRKAPVAEGKRRAEEDCHARIYFITASPIAATFSTSETETPQAKVLANIFPPA